MNICVAFTLKVVVEVEKSKREVSDLCRESQLTMRRQCDRLFARQHHKILRGLPQLTEYHIDRGSLSTGTWNK